MLASAFIHQINHGGFQPPVLFGKRVRTAFVMRGIGVRSVKIFTLQLGSSIVQKTKFTSQLIAGAILSAIMTTLSSQVVEGEQNTVSLLRTTCVGSGSGRWRANEENVAIGRAVYRSAMNLSPSNGSASVTCRIKADNSRPVFQTLRLEFGMLDSDTFSPPTTVNLYLNGRQVGSRQVSPGQAGSFLENVSNVNNVSIETTCASRSEYCGRVYFFQTALERIPEPPRRRK